MSKRIKKYIQTARVYVEMIPITYLIIIACVIGVQPCRADVDNKKAKLYWFIPDGMRADPDIFNIYRWADEGKLPNIKRLMSKGSYGFATPVFPSHTPVNFATLFTGMLPKKHFVADGPMHVEGRPLNRVSVGGFSSAAKKAEPIWVTLEKSRKDVFLLSVPGSTPPELETGVTVRGRWGGWGADFHAVNFEAKRDNSMRFMQGRNARLFTFGPPLTEYVEPEKTAGSWKTAPMSFAPVQQAELTHYGAKVYAYIYDSTDDEEINYDRIRFSFDRETSIVDLSEGEWSEWHPITLTHTSGGVSKNIDSEFKIKVIKLDDDGFFRVRFFYDNLNEFVVDPPEISMDLHKNVGPMVDFVDNFPPQLIYYPEDRTTFLEEMQMSFKWHTSALEFALNRYEPDILISDIYSPNQMLTSRWWMGSMDPNSDRYGEVSKEERSSAGNEVLQMYQMLDKMVGVLLDKADSDTYVVLSSDHGACPLNKWVRLNNLFAKKGWLKFSIDSESGEPKIDWEKSTVIFLKMDNIYIDPDGLSGDWHRASGDEYEKLRAEVIEVLQKFEDPETGIHPASKIVKWEDAERFLDLPAERIGDLVVANARGYGWNEEMTKDRELFSKPLKSGYKQAIIPKDESCIWAPFMIAGPGVKENHEIKDPVPLQNEYPTIMHLLGEELPAEIDGVVVEEILN